MVANGSSTILRIVTRTTRNEEDMADTLPHTLLSDREFRVFLMIAAGRSMREIAAGLSISVKTVSIHKLHIMQKMHFSKRADLVRYALRHKLLDDTGALFD